MEELSERFGGVDWANDSHAVTVVDDEGTMIDEFEVPDSSDGLGDMCRRLKVAAVRRVAIERPDGPVVDALLEAGFEVVVVVSRSVKALRVRYGASGNKSDRADAYVLADCLRTDGHRWQSLRPDTPATVTLRSHVRARKDLVEHRVAIANQLRAHLKVVFPGPVGLFSDLDSPISLAFLRRFPWEGKAAWLSEKRLGAWLRNQGYGGRRATADLYGHLTQAPAGLLGDEGEARSSVTLAFVTLLETLDSEIKTLNRRIRELLDAHPDGHIFRSLPRANTIRAATLLAEIGDAAPGSPNPKPSPPSPESPPPPAPPANIEPSHSGGPPTRNSETPSATLPATRPTATNGLATATSSSAPTARATPTPNAFSPAPGPTSSGAAGKTESRTIRPSTAPSNASNTEPA